MPLIFAIKRMKKICITIISFTLAALSACGSENTATTSATLSPLQLQGQRIFTENCAVCHASSGDTVIAGPSLDGIASRAGSRNLALDARQYIEISILDPDFSIVEGFPNAMPPDFGKKLTGEELDALVAYLLTLE